jgi:hypothetical protein
MNTMIYYGISLLILSILVLIVGMIKPKWIFLWMEQPGRMPVTMLAMVIFMIAAILYGEGNKQLQHEREQLSKKQLEQPIAEVPVPTPTVNQAPVATPEPPPAQAAPHE